MKNNFHFLESVVLVAVGLALGGCSKQTTTEEVDGQPVPPGGGTKPFPEKKPPEKDAKTPEKSRPAGKYTIREIMQKSFKQEGNLKDLILEDMATAEQKTQFIDYVENLAQYKIRKGDADSWKEKTTALIAAAKGSDLAALEKATNCKACHSVHKIYPPTKK
jgi:hypothetical protein